MNAEQLKAMVRDVPDFPEPGILFRDITPLLADPDARAGIRKALVEPLRSIKIDAVAGIEARGFLFGVSLADDLGVPFIPIRKAGKLPWEKVREDYALEYGTASIEIHRDAIKPGQRVLIHDDLLATGGTCLAAARLIERMGGRPAAFSFIINLTFLNGGSKIETACGMRPFEVLKY
ncbi:MAG: adenine phosphoribosyltransferase [Bacteroidota bacterium]